MKNILSISFLGKNQCVSLAIINEDPSPTQHRGVSILARHNDCYLFFRHNRKPSVIDYVKIEWIVAVAYNRGKA